MKRLAQRRNASAAISTAVLALGAFAAFGAAAAHATSPQDAVITVQTAGASDTGPAGPFTATGPICLSGQTETLFRSAHGFERGFGGQIRVGKRFTCDDGSGTFDLLLEVSVRFDPVTITYHWVAAGGTGAYADLHGTGTGTGTPTDDFLLDIYTGTLHSD
jgi:hypothetical protein